MRFIPGLSIGLGCLLATGFGAGLCGCSTGTTVLTKTVTTTGSVVGKTTVVAGKVATRTVTTVTKAGFSAATSVAKTAGVTFVDTATGVAKQVPYVEGMKLYAASKTAQVDLALKSIQILRGMQTINAATDRLRSGSKDVPLQPGDVIRLSRPYAALNKSG